MNELSPNAVLFMDWLMDPRPAKPGALYDENNLLREDSPVKGTQTEWCLRYGHGTSAPSQWRKDPRFRKLFRQQVMAEVQDPTYMLDVVRNVRDIATGPGEEVLDRQGNVIAVKYTDVLKAADLYSRMTGYVAPEAPKEPAKYGEMDLDELEEARQKRDQKAG